MQLNGARLDDRIAGGPGRLPGNAHLSFPGAEGDALLMLLDARGVECSTGSACSAGVARPSHVLLAVGADADRARSSLRFSLGHTTTEADVEALLEVIGPVVERARRAGMKADEGARRDERGSGLRRGRGARAVDAGHDVTGVHLALSPDRQTLRSGARGCCSVEDSHDARRVADELGIPFYVWDLADRFPEDVVEDFVAEYAAGRTPNPCLRCNEKIKFTAVLDRARAGLRRGRHRAPRPAGRRRSARSVDAAKDQSYVLGVLPADQLAAAVFPLGSMTKDRVREIAAERGFAVAAQPDSHDICFIPDGDTRGFLSRRLGSLPGPVVDVATG